MNGYADETRLAVVNAVHFGLVQLLGCAPFAVSYENDGHLIRNVVPNPAASGTTSSWGADSEFFWHSDNPHLPFGEFGSDPRPFVPHVPELLRRAQRRGRADRADRDRARSSPRSTSRRAALARGRLRRRRPRLQRCRPGLPAPGGRAVLETGADGRTRVRYDRGTTHGRSPGATAVLDTSRRSSRRCRSEELMVEAGDFLVFDNYRVLHRRRAFTPGPRRPPRAGSAAATPVDADEQPRKRTAGVRKFRVAVIGGRPAPVGGAKELDIDVVLVHEKGAYDAGHRVHCERIVHAPLDDGPAILDALQPLHDERPFDRVMTTTEPAAESTGFVVDALGLPGVTEATARALKDKALTRELLDKHDLSPVRYRMVAQRRGGRRVPGRGRRSDRPQARRRRRQPAHPPRRQRGGGRPRLEHLPRRGSPARSPRSTSTGPVVSVDSFSFEGRHVPIGYSEYRMNDRFVEWEVSTPSRVAVPQLEELRELTVAPGRRRAHRGPVPQRVRAHAGRPAGPGVARPARRQRRARAGQARLRLQPEPHVPHRAPRTRSPPTANCRPTPRWCRRLPPRS